MPALTMRQQKLCDDMMTEVDNMKTDIWELHKKIGEAEYPSSMAQLQDMKLMGKKAEQCEQLWNAASTIRGW